MIVFQSINEINYERLVSFRSQLIEGIVLSAKIPTEIVKVYFS